MNMSGTVIALLVASLTILGLLSVQVSQSQVNKLNQEKSHNSSTIKASQSTNNNSCPFQPKPQELSEQDFATYVSPALNSISSYISGFVDPVARPAISANVVYQDKIIWEGNFGQLSRTNTTEPTGNTIYRIASISKVFPTIFLFKLWESGLVKLNDLVTKYAPNFSIGNPFGTDIQPTLHDIASQLSGLPSLLPYDLLKRDYFRYNGTLEEMLQIISKEVLVVEPRSTCHYSNLAYALLGHILERNFTEDGNFENWAETNIVQRLKLTNTGFEINDQVVSRMALGYYADGVEAPLADLNWFRPAGNYYSSARDLAALTMSLMDTSDNTILKHETLQEMLRPVARCGYGYLSAGTGTPWEINLQQSYVVVRKDGDLDGYSSTIAMVPDLDLSFTVLMSGQRPVERPIATSVLNQLLPVFVDVMRRKPYPVKPANQPSRYIGLYEIDNIQSWNVTATENKLSMTNPNIPDSPYKTVGLSYVKEGVLKLIFLGGTYPCVIGQTNLEIQNEALLHFKTITNGKYNQFDMPGLNLFGFKRQN